MRAEIVDTDYARRETCTHTISKHVASGAGVACADCRTSGVGIPGTVTFVDVIIRGSSQTSARSPNRSEAIVSNAAKVVTPMMTG